MRRSFSFITAFGLVFGISVFCYAILAHSANIRMFFDLNGFLLVAGGAMASSMIAFHGRYVFRSLTSIFSNLFPYHITPKELTREVRMMIEWSRDLQKEGKKGFENKVKSANLKDPFIVFGLQLLSADYPKEELDYLLQNFINSYYERQMVQVTILHTMAGFSPAFGMVGTLVGMVTMMGHMGSDIASIGPGLSVALLATLYGLLLAQMIFKPAAEKVQQTQEMVKYRHSLLKECFLMIQSGENAFKIQDHVNSFLDPSIHIDLANPEKSK